MKRIYITPSIELIPTRLESNLLQVSYIGGNNPGGIGAPISGAKQGSWENETYEGEN